MNDTNSKPPNCTHKDCFLVEQAHPLAAGCPDFQNSKPMTEAYANHDPLYTNSPAQREVSSFAKHHQNAKELLGIAASPSGSPASPSSRNSEASVSEVKPEHFTNALTQQLPSKGKVSVTSKLLAALKELEPQQNNHSRTESIRLAIHFIEEQEKKGIEKYGRSLETWNGRDPLLDAMTEDVDRWQYQVQARIERADMIEQIAALKEQVADLQADYMELQERSGLVRVASETIVPDYVPSKATHEDVVNALCKSAFKNSKDHGFWKPDMSMEVNFPDDTPNRSCIPTKLVLMHSELSEGLEAIRDDKNAPTAGISAFDYWIDQAKGKNKPEGIVAELADCCIRIFDLCGAFGWDLGKAIQEKMAYNAGRPFMHGKQF